MARGSERPATWEEARGRIDRGETGDKVAAADPAAAPLGTDAEAGGSATAPEHVRRSFEAEVAVDGRRAAARPRTGSFAPWIVLAVGLGVGVLLAIGVAAV